MIEFFLYQLEVVTVFVMITAAGIYGAKIARRGWQPKLRKRSGLGVPSAVIIIVRELMAAVSFVMIDVKR